MSKCGELLWNVVIYLKTRGATCHHMAPRGENFFVAQAATLSHIMPKNICHHVSPRGTTCGQMAQNGLSSKWSFSTVFIIH